ncbi:MAG: type IV secretory system conjugative DNA transfer family protein, partial [Rhodospirillaceae bacterium]
LVGTILHVLYAEEEKTLARVATILSDPQRSFSQTLHHMMQTNNIGTTENPMVHPVVASAAREVLNKAENERSGVLSTAMSFLGLYRDPTVARTTSACDWRVSDLMDGRQPVSLYLVIPPSDISRTKPLVRLMLNQIGRRLTEGLVGNDRRPKHQLLMMLDEFPALGRLDFFETALAFMAGYGIRAYLIAQSLNQISKAYGENNSILDNCHVRIAFSSNDERTAKRISDALGMTTETRAQKNYAGSRLALWLGHVMVSRQETARPLLTPGEIMQLPATDQLLLVSGVRPIRAQRVRYYEDRNLGKRVLAPPLLDIGDYADKPASRDHDWQGQVRGPDARLAVVVASPNGNAADQGGGRERQVETPTAPARAEPQPPGPERTSPALAVEEVSGPVRRAYAMANGEDVDAHRGHGREFLPE